MGNIQAIGNHYSKIMLNTNEHTEIVCNSKFLNQKIFYTNTHLY